MSRFRLPHIARRIAIFGAACLASLSLTAGSARAQGLYQPPTTLTAATTPQGVAAADFALSGFQGLVVTNSKSRNMQVFLGNGPGTFAGYTSYRTCTGPTAVLAQDVTDDGYPDILVACPSANQIEVFVNDRTGHFGGTVYTFTATDPVAMVLGNFTGDGQPDLAAASGTGGITTIVDINGTPMTHTIAAPGTLSGITTGDFNHDGHLDLAVSDSANNNVHVFNGDGAGNFTASGSYGAGTGPSAIAAADFNTDGNLDLAVTNAGSNSVSILLGSAGGTFATQAPQSAGLDPIAISVTDVNSDGFPDVVAYDAQNASSTSQGAIAVLLGNGDGTLQTAQIANLTDVPGTDPVVADFNRDGKPDLATTLTTTNKAAVLLNNTLPTPYPGGRSFAASNASAAGNGNMADSIAAGDFNKDGQLDVAVSYLEDNAVRVLLNNGSGGFNLGAAYPVGQQPYFVTSGDLNGDGFPDLVAVNSSINSPHGTISVLLNNGKAGNGTFATAATYTVGRLPYQAAIGDLNGDGYPDLAVTNYGANTVSILYGSKAGTFIAGPTLPTGAEPYGVAIGDFEHNGRPGVAVSCFGVDMLYVFPNSGNGTFGTPYMYSTGAGPMTLVTGDFNRDGKLDIVVANATGNAKNPTPTTSGNNVSFFAGNGDGSFQAGVISPSLNFPDSIAAGDVNGDGILDIVGVAPNYNAVEVTLGKGDGTFGTTAQRAAGEFTAKQQPWALVLGDFNNDGQLDIVTANTYNQVNITIPAYQQRYMTQYPPVTGGKPSVDVLLNASASTISLGISPTPPLPANNTGATLTASVQPALTGGSPTGSVIFENAAGAPYGTGPYTLANGVATANTGRLGSGQYLFTTLYSGDASYQPTTASGSGFAVTVAGTPVTLTLSSPVVYSQTFVASVSVAGSAPRGAPAGTVTIYGVSGTGATFTLSTITLVANGNNGTGTATYTAVGPNLNVGTYQLYGYYTPAGTSTYPAGSSSNVLLTVTPEPTSLAVSCSGGFFGDACTATVTASLTNTAVPAGNVVNFSVNGGAAVTETIGANGKATYNFSAFAGSFTVAATFPQQSNYLTSTNSTTVLCFIFCGLDRTGGNVPIVSFNALGYSERFATPAANRDLELDRGRPLPFSTF